MRTFLKVQALERGRIVLDIDRHLVQEWLSFVNRRAGLIMSEEAAWAVLLFDPLVAMAGEPAGSRLLLRAAFQLADQARSTVVALRVGSELSTPDGVTLLEIGFEGAWEEVEVEFAVAQNLGPELEIALWASVLIELEEFLQRPLLRAALMQEAGRKPGKN